MGRLDDIRRTVRELTEGLDVKDVHGSFRRDTVRAYGLLDPASGRLDYACSGYSYPLLRRADGEVVELGAGSLPLGLRPEVAPAQGNELFNPGDLLVMYTDGLPETLDGAGNAFGFDRLGNEVTAGGAAPVVHERILSALERFAASSPLVDDRSLLIISRGRERDA